jgi:G:T-mismatch repair DNA endonuclease (very short patch repair protein)
MLSDFNKRVGNHSENVVKQWKSIKSNPELYSKLVKNRSEKMKSVWNNYSEEEKDRRIRNSYTSYKRWRSKPSDDLKQMMIDNGLYYVFSSEELFHGFIPDEINHDLKIIVEMFGDIYHCNPKKYTDPLQRINTIDRTVGEQWIRDKKRFTCFKKYGYETIVVWDSDFKKNPINELKRIRDFIDKRKLNEYCDV